MTNKMNFPDILAIFFIISICSLLDKAFGQIIE